MGRDGKLTTYLAVGMVTAGFVLMFVSWNGAANLDYVQGQVPFLLSGTIPGLALTLTGLTLALVQEMRRSTARVLAQLQPSSVDAPLAVAAPVAAEGPSQSPAAVPVDGDHVMATAATFHDPECHIISGRADLTPMGPAVATERGLAPCRICEPATAAA